MAYASRLAPAVREKAFGIGSGIPRFEGTLSAKDILTWLYEEKAISDEPREGSPPTVVPDAS